MPRIPGLTSDDIAERHRRVLELTDRGVAAVDIAAQLGMSITHVHRIRGRRRGAPSRRPFTTEEIARAEALFADGCSAAEVARTLGRHPASVSRRWRGRSWDRSTSAEFGVLRQRAVVALPGI